MDVFVITRMMMTCADANSRHVTSVRDDALEVFTRRMHAKMMRLRDRASRLERHADRLQARSDWYGDLAFELM